MITANTMIDEDEHRKVHRRIKRGITVTFTRPPHEIAEFDPTLDQWQDHSDDFYRGVALGWDLAQRAAENPVKPVSTWRPRRTA